MRKVMFSNLDKDLVLKERYYYLNPDEVRYEYGEGVYKRLIDTNSISNEVLFNKELRGERSRLSKRDFECLLKKLYFFKSSQDILLINSDETSGDVSDYSDTNLAEFFKYRTSDIDNFAIIFDGQDIKLETEDSSYIVRRYKEGVYRDDVQHLFDEMYHETDLMDKSKKELYSEYTEGFEYELLVNFGYETFIPDINIDGD